jgi:Ca-activated chloride channel family protein
VTVSNTLPLYGLLLLIPVIVLQIRGYFRGRRDLTHLGSHFSPEDVSSLFVVKWFLSAFAFDVFLVFAVFAAAGLSWGQEPVEEDRTGLDVSIALDVSRSMLVSDLAPSRIDQARELIAVVARELPFARVSLVVFKGAATVLLPMTSDLASVEIVLEGVGPGLVTAPGTNIEEGLLMALDRFPSASLAHRTAVLITDGESLSGDIDDSLTRMRQSGIPLFTVLAGTAAGGAVPAGDGTALLDESGRPVISRANGAMLRRLASESGGTFLELGSATTAETLVAELTKFAQIRESEGFRLVPRQRYRLFLTIALATLLFSLMVRSIRWRGMF